MAVSYLLPLIGQEVGCVDVKNGKGRSWIRYTEPEVDGVGTTDGSVVGKSLEGNDCVLRRKKGTQIEKGCMSAPVP